MSTPRTLYDKLWDAHAFAPNADGSCLLYIDRHLINEVSSPQAFDALQAAGRQPWRPGASVAILDHIVPTSGREKSGHESSQVSGVRPRVLWRLSTRPPMDA